MKAMILAAGLGTRLRPWTLSHPKALVPVGGVPMLQRVICRLRDDGFDRIVVNVHHFASQITDFLAANDFGVDIAVSDESGELLDTGGGVLHARRFLATDDAPFLVHNVDILSSADLPALMSSHRPESVATLLVSERDSSRRLVFDKESTLMAWHNLRDGAWRPEGYKPAPTDKVLAFSGIYVLSTEVFGLMEAQGFSGRFPIMDFFLRNAATGRIKGYADNRLQLIDIGKPETLSRANCGLLSDNQISS